MVDILSKAKEKFFQMITDYKSDPFYLKLHVPEAEKWAKHLLKKYPDLDAEVVLLAVWLHDIGHYPVNSEEDHAIISEKRAKTFLEEQNYSKNKMNKVLHCIRAHRCKDVMPNTFEAKIIAFVDSASHITDDLYFRMAKEDKEKKRAFRVYAKMERDFRDLSAFPEIQNELKELFETWKKLIKIYENLEID